MTSLLSEADGQGLAGITYSDRIFFFRSEHGVEIKGQILDIESANPIIGNSIVNELG